MKLTGLVLVTLSLLPAGTTVADLSGNWTIDGDVQGNAVGLACVIAQATDAKIAGKCQVNGSETTEIEGAATDAGFKFAFTIMGYTLTYTGTVEGDSMNGDIEVAGANGKFTGKRTK